MDRDCIHWGATAGIKEIRRRKPRNPHICREMTGNYHDQEQCAENRYERTTTNLGPLKTKQKKPRRDRRIDGELLTRVNRFGRGIPTSNQRPLETMSRKVSAKAI